MEIRWQTGPLRPQLGAGEVDVWRADLAVGGDGVRELLSDRERERAARFVRARDGLCWAHAHGILRALLARYVDADPRTLRFEEGVHGKPRLAAAAASGRAAGADGRAAGLRFNLSHSGETAFV